MWKWFSVIFVITSAAHGDALGQDPVSAIGAVIVEWNRKCWPLAFQTDEEQDPKTRKECEAVAVKTNELFGFAPGGGFGLSAEGTRALFKIPLQALVHNIKPCNKTPHDPRYSQYVGKLVIDGGAKNEVCTAPVPNDLPITELTCEVWGGGLGRAPCANNGDTNDCGWAATISVYTRPSLKGNRYCWWCTIKKAGHGSSAFPSGEQAKWVHYPTSAHLKVEKPVGGIELALCGAQHAKSILEVPALGHLLGRPGLLMPTLQEAVRS